MTFFESYFEALGTTEKYACEQALARAYEIRKFEIELYWKRATYFWAFQLVAFAALGLIFKDGKLADQSLLPVPASIGVITAFAGYLTARGSKFWQENWEAHVDLLEHQTNTRLTQVIFCRKSGPQFSVTRVNESLLFIIAVGWAIALLLETIPNAISVFSNLPQVWHGTAFIVAVTSACGWLWIGKRSKFHGRAHYDGTESWMEYPAPQKARYPYIIWRDPIGTYSLRVSDQDQNTKVPG